jgi:hypothetical protein
MDEIEYKLKQSFEYHGPGEKITCEKIFLSAPAYNGRLFCQRVKKLYFEAVKKLESKASSESDTEPSKTSETETDTEISGSDFIGMMYMSGIDIEKFMEEFEGLICSGVCRLDEKTTVSKTILSKMTFQDIEGLYGEYMVHFLVQL